jgi:hypothetical protein
MNILELAGSPILSGLTGGLFSIGTGILNFFQKREDNKHALLRMDKERELLVVTANVEQAKAAGMLALAREQGASAAFTASIENDGRVRGEHRLVTSLRSSVRPVLVFGYQIAFFIALGFSMLAWFKQWAPTAELEPLIQYMVVSIINTSTMTVSWYFGQRQMDKVGIAWGNKTAGASVGPTRA